MTKLACYEDFINRVEELGFMAFSDILPGWTSLSEETHAQQWHTGEYDTDPWQWKDRAAQEKRLAFGCLLNGHKGFISKEWYPVFYSAYHPAASIEERWKAGVLNQTVSKVWQLFSEGIVLSTDDIRYRLNVTKKHGAGAVDTALRILQKEYYLTISGNRRKLNARGEPYGWPANTYEQVKDWAPPDWLVLAGSLKQTESRSKIFDTVCAQCQSPDLKRISKTLGL